MQYNILVNYMKNWHADGLIGTVIIIVGVLTFMNLAPLKQ